MKPFLRNLLNLPPKKPKVSRKKMTKLCEEELDSLMEQRERRIKKVYNYLEATSSNSTTRKAGG